MSDTDDDMVLSTYKGKNLSQMSITTSTVAYDSNLRIAYEDLSKYVKADHEKILAVKSTCLPLVDCLDGGKYTKADRILKRRARNKKKRGSMYGKPSRTLSGNQLYFQSSVEFVQRYGDKYHNIRISPARGSIQIQGVQDPIFQTAESEIYATLEYIKQKMCIDKDFQLTNRRVIIVNIKSSISPDILKDNTHIRIDKMAVLIQNLMELQKDNKELPLEIPYRIIFVTNPHEAGSYIRIKFITPVPENLDRKTTIKIFSGCKINFLGCPTVECPFHIYKFLDAFIELYKEYLFFNKQKVVDSKTDVNNYISNLHKNKYTWVRMVKNNLSKP